MTRLGPQPHAWPSHQPLTVPVPVHHHPLSILGMHLFGCKFSLKTDTGDTIPDRKNFDSLLWAIVTVFQVQLGRPSPAVHGWSLEGHSPARSWLRPFRDHWG